jgi:hypothetical protein
VAFDTEVGIYVDFEDPNLPTAGDPSHVVLIVTP